MVEYGHGGWLKQALRVLNDCFFRPDWARLLRKLLVGRTVTTTILRGETSSTPLLDASTSVAPPAAPRLRWNEIVEKLQTDPNSVSLNLEALGQLLDPTHHGDTLSRNEHRETVYLRSLASGVVAAYYCVKEGDRGDADGFGVDPDTWAVSFLTQDGTILVPFELSDSPAVCDAVRKYGSPWT